jgi:hypothetical protein
MAVGLSVYRLRLKDHRAEEWWQFGRNTPQDAYAELDSYFRTRRGHLVRLGDADADGNYSDQRALLLSRVVRSENSRMLAGLFLKGEAGTVREIRNFDDPEADPAYRTAVNEGILTPLYARLHLEDGRRYGVAILQTLGTDGLKGYVDRDLRRYFRNEAAERRTIDLAQLLDRQVLEAFATQGSLQDVVLVNSGQTERSRQAMQRNTIAGDQLGHDGDKLEMRVARHGGFGVDAIRRLWDRIQGQGDPRTLVNVEGMPEIDDLKVEILHGGRRQTFSLLNPDDSPIRIDITGEIAFGPDGLPTWESVHRAAGGAWESVSAMINGGA